MAKLTILGNDKPIIGQDEMYSIYALDTLTFLSTNILQPKKLNEKTQWAIMVQTKTGWRDGGSHKEGPYAPYKFGQKSLAHKGIKIVVKRGSDSGELIIHPQRAKEPKITKVELLDANYKPIPKGKKISYKDTIIARAHCVEMFRMQVAFTLWEDDAEGQGHNAKANALNKINPIPSYGYVNEKGIAEVIFRLPMYTMAVQIANARIASGDQNEGSTHEYYVTADVVDAKIQKASPNVNVANPTYTPPPPRTKPKTSTTRPPAKPKTTEKPKPKPDSAKFPVTTGGRSQSDRQGKILSAEFVDNAGNRVHSSRVGTTQRIKITATGMVNKYVRVKIWEDDVIKDDELYNKVWKLVGDSNFIAVQLTRKMFDKASDGGDSKKQDYYIEIIHNDTSVTSQNIPINATAAPTTIPKTRTTAEVNQSPQQKKSSTCLCQEQYKNLYWGGKVSCEFRKKVVQIADRLGKDPNLLMAGMALETGRTFSPTAGSGTSYVGLIQFGDAAAESVGTTRSALLKMTAVQQLDYVEKYLQKKKDKINTLTDFYMSILMPVDVGKGNQPYHVVFDNEYPLSYKKDGKTLTDLSKSRHYGYRQNPSFLHEKGEKSTWENGGKKKYKGPGKTYIWEIEKSIKKFYDEGANNTVKIYECQKSEQPVSAPSHAKGTWNIIVTERFTGKNCTHIERTEVRKNCRRGKIDVYDHNNTLVLTISDCLLEGIAGEDRMVTNGDIPFGEYEINRTTPFYHSDSSNIKSYGPNPRLVFEPISGEAKKSGRSAIRIHGGRQVGYKVKALKRAQGCIRVWDNDAKRLYDWWQSYSKKNPNVKPGKVTVKK